MRVVQRSGSELRGQVLVCVWEIKSSVIYLILFEMSDYYLTFAVDMSVFKGF